jgi:hypothetical protein
MALPTPLFTASFTGAEDYIDVVLPGLAPRVNIQAGITTAATGITITLTNRTTTNVRVHPSARFTGTVTLIAVDPQSAVKSIAITSPTQIVTVALSYQFTATATYADGTTGDLSSFASWVSSTPANATVNSTGLVTGVASGATTISATYQGITGSLAVQALQPIVPSGRYPSTAPKSIDLTVRLPVGSSGGLPTAGTLFSITDPSGAFKLSCDGSGNSVWTARGSTSTSVAQSFYWLPANGSLQVRAFYDAVTAGDNALQFAVNGVYQWPFAAFQGAPVGPDIGAATGVSLGSDFGSDVWAGGSYTYVLSLGQTHTVPTPVSEFVWMGDSTTAVSSLLEAAAYELYTPAQWWTRPGIANLAAPGAVVADMKTRWQNFNCDTLRGQAGVKAFIYLIGVNDITAGTSSSTILAAIQDLRNTCHSDNPSAMHIVGAITPCHAFLSAPQYAVWQSVNAGLSGLTGFSAVVNSYVTAIGAGPDNLAPAYDYGDGLHPNNAARIVMAAAFKTALQGLSLLP